MNRTQLRELAIHETIREEAFSLDGEERDDRYVLKLVEGGWSVFFFERGERVNLTVFDTEDEACDHLAAVLLSDPTTRQDFETRADVERRLHKGD